MANKINLIQAAKQVASISGCSQTSAETFLKSMFSLLSDLLQDGKRVKIKGLGNFRKVEQAIIYEPDRQLSDYVNMPFSSFEAVELDDEITAEILNAETSLLNNMSIDAPNESILHEEDNIDTSDNNEISEIDKQEIDIANQVDENTSTETMINDEEINTDDIECSQTGNTEDQTNSISSKDEDIIEESLDNNKTEFYENDSDVDSTKIKNGGISISIYIISILVALVVGGVIGYFAKYIADDYTINSRIDKQQEQLDSIQATIKNSKVDTITNTQTNIVEPTKCDTTTKFRLITTMAQEYYGDINFWPYIYEENKEKLGHPEKIPAGTILIIPPADKYGIDSLNPNSVHNAKLKGVEIYAKFRK